MSAVTTLACCAVLESALEALARNGLESNENARVLVERVRGAVLGKRVHEDALAGWGELFARDEAPTGALGTVGYTAQLLVSALGTRSEAWALEVSVRVQLAATEALEACGEDRARAACMVREGYLRALAVAKAEWALAAPELVLPA